LKPLAISHTAMTISCSASTPGFLLLAAIITEVPIAMVVLSLVLPQRVARWANLVAAGLTIVYVIGLGSAAPHYIFIGSIETLGCILIGWLAWTWRESERRISGSLRAAGAGQLG
jgi:hypothetical protein